MPRNENPAVRLFRSGRARIYGYLNAQLDRGTKKPQVQAQLRLFRDRKQVYQGKVMPLDPTGQPDLKKMVAGGCNWAAKWQRAITCCR